ncbi:MAG: SRPBCC family protein [Verrucomicrobiales bacterium]|nr:SRPBCC family protein [Verrucomicrobiales bacterium]
MLPIFLALAFIAILFIIVIVGQPDEFKLSRSATISAPPEKVFPHVNDLHKWEAWSPWAKMDPNAKNSFSGPDAGTGAAMRWEGNNKVGVGTMTITESRPAEAIRFRLDFEKPMKATNSAEFTFKPEGGQTLVAWSMSGTSNFTGKIFGLLMNCDKMVGGQFEKGLAALKLLAESDGKN